MGLYVNARLFVYSLSLRLDCFTNSLPAHINTLTGDGFLDKAAICSRAGDSVWAHSPGFEISTSESTLLANGFDNPGPIMGRGIGVEGVSYFYSNGDQQSIYFKKGSEGIIAVRTNQAIIVAHYGASILPNEAIHSIDKVAGYLMSLGY